LLSLSEASFISIIKSKSILLPNEDSLFELFYLIFVKDPKKRYLMSFVNLPTVTYELLRGFVETFTYLDFDEQTFDLIKQCFHDRFCMPHTSCTYPKARWEHPPILTTQREVILLFQMIDQYATPGKSRVQTVNELIERQKVLKQENQ
jgi:hypothetical protein